MLVVNSSTGREEPSAGVTCITGYAALLSFNVLIKMSALGRNQPVLDDA